MSRGFFITGTDTGVGKTRVSLSIMELIKMQGHTVAGMKPVAAGADQTESGLRNEDAIMLQSASSHDVDYALLNPFVFVPAIAPHIAAQQAGIKISIETITRCFEQLQTQNDFVIVEGAGGWCVPIDQKNTMADVALALDLPVILVVGIRLGCINHALLTAQRIREDGVALAGWVANHIDPDMEFSAENVQTLQERLPAPCLGQIPYDVSAKTEHTCQFIQLKI